MGIVSLWDDKNVLTLIMAMVAQLCKYIKTHWGKNPTELYTLKINFMMCELYLIKPLFLN